MGRLSAEQERVDEQLTINLTATAMLKNFRLLCSISGRVILGLYFFGPDALMKSWIWRAHLPKWLHKAWCLSHSSWSWPLRFSYLAAVAGASIANLLIQSNVSSFRQCRHTATSILDSFPRACESGLEYRAVGTILVLVAKATPNKLSWFEDSSPTSRIFTAALCKQNS